MAAKKPVAGRKPAITNLARPQGFMDDIVAPVKKATKQVKRLVSDERMTRQFVKDYKAGFEQHWSERGLAQARIARNERVKSKLTGRKISKPSRGGGSSRSSGGGGPRGNDRDNYVQ